MNCMWGQWVSLEHKHSLSTLLEGGLSHDLVKVLLRWESCESQPFQVTPLKKAAVGRQNIWFNQTSGYSDFRENYQPFLLVLMHAHTSDIYKTHTHCIVAPSTRCVQHLLSQSLKHLRGREREEGPSRLGQAEVGVSIHTHTP